MGIIGLWDIIGEGEVWSIADYAAQHFKEKGRPLRIAVDSACWRFANLTEEQVRRIQESEPASNPLEKTILWRILRLIKLNIKLIFIEDGPHRPWKRGKRGGSRVDYELIRLTHQLLDKLKIPHHRAPSEAEAECGRLQALGIVDAVWSDDSDAMMFGCGVLIKQHRKNGSNVHDHVRIYRASALLEKHDLDTESLVLFALLSGGDYNVSGLKGCGPKTASLLSKRHLGLAHELCQASKTDMPRWRQRLQEAMMQYGGVSSTVPSDFPSWKAVGHYRSPHVSTPEQLHTLATWNGYINQNALRVMLRERFNFTTREYLKHIAPTLLTKFLARSNSEDRSENLKFGIKLKRTITKRIDGEPAPPKSEVKITFSPTRLVEFDLSHCPPGEDWTKFQGKDGTPYDPTKDVETEILECFLRHGLPDGHLDELREQIQPAKKKRKKDEEAAHSALTPKKRQKCSASEVDNAIRDESENDPQGRDVSVAAPKKRGRPPKNGASKSSAGKKSTTRATMNGSVQGQRIQSESPPTPLIPTFKRPRALPAAIIDLSGGDDDDGWHDDFGFGFTPDLIPHSSGQSKIPSQHSFAPVDVISPDVLRALRGNSTLVRNPVPNDVRNAGSIGQPQQLSNQLPLEIIDLT